ncbi:cbb3-type cytochrome c oxidase subunit I [Acetobacteraceae bacterium ESL0709]|nr:cbb3-type cytochrome c oxidase subunit I [Acetobacteraceae bacterium ESL0697]MDF7677522.1 cbb3-type cytochrome c oxidase subunit I [Acetobacteraceae bacterium ESL0709]
MSSSCTPSSGAQPPGASSSSLMEEDDPLSPWWKRILIAVIILASCILTFITVNAYHVAPPVPEQVVAPNGQIIATRDDINEGESVFQRFGLMNNGSVWGHGAYIGPDFSALALHRQVLAAEDAAAQDTFHSSYQMLDKARRAAVDGQTAIQFKVNLYDAKTGILTLGPVQAQAWQEEPAHWQEYFANTAENGGLEPGVVPSPQELKQLAAWFSWAAWASATQSPGTDHSYTNNFPYEPAAGNTPIHGAMIWSMLSLLTLLGGIGGAVYIRDRYPSAAWVTGMTHRLPNRLFPGRSSRAQKALVKFMIVVAALFFLQTLLGGATAHYRIDGASFYGIPLQQLFPSNVVRSWHLQSAIFWIATAYVAATLYLALAFRGPDDTFANSTLLVTLLNLLFVAFAVVVAGSFLGIWLGYLQTFGKWWEDLGATGWEFMEQGRLWHGLLIVGLTAWIALLCWICAPVWKNSQKERPLLTAFVLSALAIPLFYTPVLLINHHANYSVVEIWRFWIIHLWVEGYFEFFATTLVATMFYLLGITRRNVALRTIYFDGILFFTGGVLGTCHHWYFTGQGQIMMAFGALMSAMEVVPLTLLCAEAWDFIRTTRLDREENGGVTHRYVYYFLLACGFWNFVGAGMCGFFINLPIVSYYEVGTMLTPNHGHAAMMGVFGMAALAMVVMVTQQVATPSQWRALEKYARIAFWGTNIGLAGMCLISLFPGGLLQIYDVMVNGYWHARSPLYGRQTLQLTLEWLRMIPDTVFILFGSLPVLMLVVSAWLRFLSHKGQN